MELGPARPPSPTPAGRRVRNVQNCKAGARADPIPRARATPHYQAHFFFFLIQYYTGLIVVAFEQNHNVSKASPNHLPPAGQ